MTIARIACCFLMLCGSARLMSQDAEALANDIAKAYIEGLTKDLPKEYDGEKYYYLEEKWDKKILKVKSQQFSDYLNSQKISKFKMLHDSTIYPIAYKMISGSEFHMTRVSEGSTFQDVKPSLQKAVSEICSCVEHETKSYTILEKVGFENKELVNTIQGCFAKAFMANKDVLVSDYEIKDEASVKQYGMVLYGYLNTHCRMFIHVLASDKARALTVALNYERREKQSRAGWNIVDGIKENITDTLGNQFLDERSFKLAKPVLKEAQRLYKANPSAFWTSSGIKEINNRPIQVLECVNYPKLLFYLEVEYDKEILDKIKAVKLIPRKDIPNVEEEEKNMPPPPPPPPPLPKN